MTERIQSTQVAKMVREVLKSTFPNTRFSVRSQANEIKVNWTDGPTWNAVMHAVGMFQAIATMNVDDSHEYQDTTYYGHTFRCGNEYLFCSRSLSDKAVKDAVDWYLGYFGDPSPVQFVPYHRLPSGYATGPDFVTEDQTARRLIWDRLCNTSL